jgi:ligand-binding sensor domain-containing protein/two-component sensor histidine kinase
MPINGFTQLRFDHIGTAEGLSQVNVTCIFQERRGFIWVGTDDGLNRYDGYKFIKYRPNPKDSNSLTSKFISDIVEDDDGNLWIATRNGLNKMDIKTGKIIRYLHDEKKSNSISTNNINKLAFDRSGILWIGTDYKGLDKLDIKKNNFKNYRNHASDANSISNNFVSSLYVDEKDRIWVGTQNGLNLLNKKDEKFVRFLYNKLNGTDQFGVHIRSLYESSKKQLLIGTSHDGLLAYDFENDTITCITNNYLTNKKQSQPVLSICEDSLKNIWVGTENAGLLIIDNKTQQIRRYVQDEVDRYSINGNSIYAICRDKLGNMWLGAYNGAISLFKRHSGSFTHVRRNSTSSSISNNFVWDIFEDKQKNIWIASDGGGVDRIDGETGSVRNIDNKTGLSGNNVLTIAQGADGNIWMGTWGNGVSIFNPQKNTISYLNYKDSSYHDLISAKIYALTETKDQKMWIATIDKGMYCYDKKAKKITHFTRDTSKPTGLSSNSLLSLLGERDGNLWVGTNGYGLSYLNTKTGVFTHYTKANTGLSDNAVTDIFRDKKGNLWVSTFDGLNRFDSSTKKIRSYTTDNGLPGNMINAVREDENGDIWISTNKGLSVYNSELESFKNYTTEDGLQHDEFKPHSALKASDGRLYFGGINGFNIISPSEIVEHSGFSPILITSFQIFNKPITNSADLSKISNAKWDVSYANQFDLSYKQTFFSIEFAALDFTPADKKIYAYFLEGFDKDWNYIGSRNNVSYTNVPDGHFTFKVKYQNSSNVWSPEYSLLKINIKPPFWQTWWFKSIVALTVIGLIVIYTRLRIQSIKRQKKKLERQVQKKTCEIVAQKDALEAQQIEINYKNESLQGLVNEKEWLLKEIHHRVKNNFHIVGSLLEIQSSYSKNKEAFAAIKETQHRIHSMSIIHQKLYQSETLSTINMPEYIFELVEYLRESYGIRKNIRFDIHVENIELNHAYAITLGLILNEAITNSIKYAFPDMEEGRIGISLACISNIEALLSIADNGKGLPAEFDSRAQTTMGMELLQGLTTDISGNFSIENNQGTHIKVIFDYKAGVAKDDVSFN